MTGLWPIVLRSLWGRRWRTALTATAVALGIAVILGVQTVLAGLEIQAQQAQSERAGYSDLDVRTTSTDGFTTDQVRLFNTDLPGVAAAVPLYEKRVVARAGQADINTVADVNGVAVIMVSVHTDGTSALRTVNLTSGRLPNAGSHTEVAIDSGLATVLGTRSHTSVGIGSTIQLTTQTGPDSYQVVGLTSGTSGGAAFTHSAVFASEAAMTSAFALGVHIPLVAIEVRPGVSDAQVDSQIIATFGAGNGFTVVDPRNGGAAPLQELRSLLVLMTALSLLVGAGVTANSVSLSALERRREIALLRVAGASATQVTRALFAEAVLIALIGVPFGVIAGIGLGMVMAHTFVVGGTVPAHVDNATALIAVGIGFSCGILGAAIPAVLAGRRPILDGLRPHAMEARDKTSWRLVLVVPIALALAAICFVDGTSETTTVGAALLVVALAAALPSLTPAVISVVAVVARLVSRETPYAAANLRRRRNRTALTISGLTVGVACAMATATLAAGAATASDVWITHLFIGDALVTSPVTQSDAISAALAQSPGVSRVSAVRLLSASVDGESMGVAAIDPAAYKQSGGLDLTGSTARDAAFSALQDQSTVMLPADIASSTGWTVGTSLVIDTGSERGTVRVVGIVAHSFPSGDGRESLLMSSNVARALFGVTADGFDDLMVTTTNGNLAPLRSTAASYGLSAAAVSEIQDSARQALSHSVGLLEAVAAIAVVISLFAVANTLAVNVRQGTRELALLRAVGLSRRRALRLVLLEAALMSLAGTALGLGAGALLALPMLSTSTTPGFAPPFAYATPVAFLILGSVTVATLLAAALPARRAVSTSIVSAMRYE